MPDDDLPTDSSTFTISPTPKARKGRGAVSNLQGRHEILIRESIDDGWSHGQPDPDEHEVPTARTRVIPETAKSILTRNSSPDVPFNVSLNPYRGCEHVMRQKSVQHFVRCAAFFDRF